MSIKRIQAALLVLAALLSTHAASSAPFSAETHDVYPGDFNGDGKSDLLVIAKNPNESSGIYRTDASGQPSTLLQDWSSDYLGISWYDSRYTAVIGNFDAVNGDDVLLQRNGTGTSFLLPTNAQGELYGISQYINGWGRDDYRIVAGRFNGDARADVFLQASRASGSSSVILSDGAGHLTATNQTWSNDHLGFKWSAASAIVHVGDFNGDGRDDLLVQAKPGIVLIDYDIPIPVPVFKANTFGITLATSAGQFVSINDVFSRNELGLDFSPNAADLVIGDFNGDGREDILVLARNADKPSFVVLTDGNGQLASATVNTIAAGTLDTNVRTLTADFNGDGRSEVYRVASAAGGSNTIASFNSSGGLSANVTHNPPSGAGAATAVGRTAGAWAVDDQGAATYSIPIFAPPGTAGLTPQLGFVYSSNAGNGALGVGWGLSGLSRIERCPAISASNAGAPREVRGDTADRFCLDGNQLKYFAGPAYGQAGTEYRSEVDQFARIKSLGSAGSGPAYFVVEQKNGLIYEYGNTTDSRIEWLASANVRTWVINKIRDRSGNAILFNYSEDGVNGSFRISNVQYTSNAALGIAPMYQISFLYEAMPAGEVDSTYMGNGLIRRMARLDRVDVTYNTSLIRRYELTFESLLSSSSRSRLKSIQECAGPVLECVPATTFTYQNGTNGFASAVGTGISANTDVRPMDVNGDGRSDLVFTICNPSTLTATTKYALANADGSYGAVQTIPYGYQCADFVPIDYNADGREDIMFSDAATGTWTVVLGSATGFGVVVNTSLPSGSLIQAAAVDVTGDGLDDFIWFDGSYVRYRARELSGSFSAASYALSTFIPGGNAAALIEGGRSALSRHGDFNGDGRADLLVGITNFGPLGNAFQSTRLLLGGTSPVEIEIPEARFAKFADLNGDGLSDVVYGVNPFGGDGLLRYRFSRGLSMGPEITTQPGTPLAGIVPNLMVVDVDSDGFQDIVASTEVGEGLYLARSTGEALQAPTLLAGGIAGFIVAADANGDGLGDIVERGADLTVRNHLGPLPDLLASATDGFGVGVSFTYASTGNYGLYQRQSSAVYPDQDTSGPLVVVSNAQASNGIGSDYALQQFSYEGARIGITGRGFLGFAARSWVDSRTGVQRRLEYRQVFPVVGAVKLASSTKVSSNTTFSEVQTTYQTSISGGVGEQRYLVNASSVSSSERELGGAYNNSLIRTSATTNTMDFYRLGDGPR
jgi:hypothetical protein